MARYPGLTLRILARGKAASSPAMGPGKAELMEQISRAGSISAAARAMDMSYRRAWQLVDAINESFAQPLVVTETGGKSGGGARLTRFGSDVLKRYRKMEAKASAAVASDIDEFSCLLKRAGGTRRR